MGWERLWSCTQRATAIRSDSMKLPGGRREWEGGSSRVTGMVMEQEGKPHPLTKLLAVSIT